VTNPVDRLRYREMDIQLSSCILRSCVYPSCTQASLCEETHFTLATLAVNDKVGVAELRGLLDRIAEFQGKLEVSLIVPEGQLGEIRQQLMDQSGHP